jgi:hypothetical protein
MRREEGELVRVKTELEEEKLKNADLDSKNTDLDSKATHLEIEILFSKTASELASPPPCEDCVVHEENYKWLSDRYDEELDENLQQDQQIAELHPKFDFKKHGNGIHPPTCFLFKCVSKV